MPVSISAPHGARWVASETSQGFKVSLSITPGAAKKRELIPLAVFKNLDEVKKVCKGEITVIKRKIVTSTNKIINK